EVDSDLEDSAPALPESSFCSDSPRGAARSQLGEFQENLHTFGTTNQGSRGKVMSLEEGDIGTLSLHLSMKPGDYSYFSPCTFSMWAGPEHWRFKPHHRAPAQIPGQGKSRNTKQPFEIAFDESIDFNRHFCETKVPVTLARSLQDSDNSKSTTLPPDFKYDPGNIFQMFLKPDLKVSRVLAAGSSLEPRAGIGDYDYNNPNDTSNFCPALQAADSDDDDDLAHCTGQAEDFNLTAHPEGQGAEFSRVNLTTYGELNLIPEPQKVNRLRIQYAKTAKKIDIKHLKENMWGLLTEGQKKDAAEQEEDAEEEEDKSVVAGEKTLSSITQELHHRLLPQMAQELSVPLAFACLLHLANEK
ncbi:CND2 protein, partial [Indicator maculatus]|nr:CND2 protein [Indicator maculatus]